MVELKTSSCFCVENVCRVEHVNFKGLTTRHGYIEAEYTSARSKESPCVIGLVVGRAVSELAPDLAAALPRAGDVQGSLPHPHRI